MVNTKVFNGENSNDYCGIFGEQMAEFIRYKRSQGLKYTAVPLSLRSFSRFTVSYKLEKHELCKLLVQEWCHLRANENILTQQRRIIETRQFLLFLHEKGYQVYIPRMKKLKRETDSFVPYIFNKKELKEIFRQCDSINVRPPSNMPVILPVLFRILYGCGLFQKL